jgi:hypothetical protein
VNIYVFDPVMICRFPGTERSSPHAREN